MSNLKDDAKSFRPIFQSAVHKSVIRKTSQEKDAKNLAEQFQNQTDRMRDNFKRTKTGSDFPVILSTAEQINKIVVDQNLGPQVNTKWQKIRAELDQLGSALGVPTPGTGAAAPPQ